MEQPTSIHFDRLRHLRDVVMAAPQEEFNLMYVKNTTVECGTVACAIGFAMQDPELAGYAPGFRLQGTRGSCPGRTAYSIFEKDVTSTYQDVGVSMFGVAYSEATSLFATRGGSDYDYVDVTTDGYAAINVIPDDKELFLHRLSCFFKDKGEKL